MKRWSLVLIIVGCAIVLGVCVHAKEKAIRVSDLSGLNVIGTLGKPLGTVVTVEGVVAPDDERRLKSDEGETLLKISKVTGEPLHHEVILHFRLLSFVSIEIPKPGDHFKLVGYETGGFTGIPAEAFKHIPQATTTGYQFEVHFQALKSVE
jgi:hypothetical protein